MSSSCDDADDLASSARKNIDDPTELPPDEQGWEDVLKLCTSSGPPFCLETLVGCSALRIPAIGLWSETGPTFDIGRGGKDMLGGVSAGGVAAPSRREFLEPDRGVILALRNVETGVDTSSFEVRGVLDLVELCGVWYDVGVPEPANLGVNGVFGVLEVALSVGVNGLAVMPFFLGLSDGIVVAVEAGLRIGERRNCSRIMAYRGLRNGDKHYGQSQNICLRLESFERVDR